MATKILSLICNNGGKKVVGKGFEVKRDTAKILFFYPGPKISFKNYKRKGNLEL